MKNVKTIFRTLCMLLILASCRKDDDLNVEQANGLGGDVTAQTAIDKWIADSLTGPYNIGVKYRWDPANASLFNTVTPPDESRIIPLFSTLRKVWINPYNDETGSELFMKKYSPKQLVLLGSVEYFTNTLALLGQAEGGNSIVFLDVNQNYQTNPYESINEVVKTVHHEFAHALHQIVIYPQDFIGTSSKLGMAGYTGTWFNVSAEEALANGYPSNYSMASANEDFVEMVAIMLTGGRAKWEETKASTNALARQALQQKEDYVVTYYRQVWNIDFYRLQTRVYNAMNAAFPAPPVSDLYGLGKPYSIASVTMSNTLLPQPPAFQAIFNAAKAGLAALVSNGSSGRQLDSFSVDHYSASAVILVCYFHTPADPTTPDAAIYLYSYTKNAANVFDFTLAGYNDNGNSFLTALAPMVNYFSNNNFSLTWFADPSMSIYPRAKFTPVSIPDSYFIARLLP